ncbi:apolipoprotein Ea [Syngnathus typhle]|uniref:apolipoprotein Ea n=1 Tax=Syngnathus typhle TaxID=161592 RepID=UPI002A69B4E5|nr:apolipoprotein Ea [Syngnathus typhle]
MKIFAIIATLAVISGCQGKSFFQDDSATTWEEFFQDYITELNTKADEIVKDIRSSQISRELETLIQDSMAELGAYRTNLEDKLVPYTRKTAERLGNDLQGLLELLRVRVSDARKQVEQYQQELQSIVEQNSEEVRVRVATYTHKLKKRLNKDAVEIQRQVSNYLQKLHSRTTNNIEDLRSRIDPYVAQVRDSTQAKINTVNDLVRSQVESMKDTIQTTAEDITARYEKTSQDMYNTLQEKVEELRSWFQPLVSMFNDNM